MKVRTFDLGEEHVRATRCHPVIEQLHAATAHLGCYDEVPGFTLLPGLTVNINTWGLVDCRLSNDAVRSAWRQSLLWRIARRNTQRRMHGLLGPHLQQITIKDLLDSTVASKVHQHRQVAWCGTVTPQRFMSVLPGKMRQSQGRATEGTELQQARLLESQLEQYLAAVAHHLMWLRREVLMLASIVEQQGAWKRRQEDFMVAQGQEVIRLAAAVARLEQGFTQYELVTVELVTPLAIG
ncbi:hypothetical protein WJX77_002768 [Trebouxia sp. C0004]